MMIAGEMVARRRTTAERMYGLAAPHAFNLVWLAARFTGASPDELSARVGRLPHAERPLLWFHGASAGEMAAGGRLAEALRAHGHEFTAAYTATNRSGVEFAARTSRPPRVAAFAPWDHPRWVARALDRWRPHALFLVETELWPRLIWEAHRRTIPVFCVSARVYPRDVPRYRLIRGLTVPMLQRLSGIFVQNDAERQRFVALGAEPERCVVSGNLKYLAAPEPAAGDPSLRNELAVAEPHRIVVCGSVHADEVPFVCAALARLSDDVRFIIAPRHATATAAILSACRARSWRVHRLSAGPAPPDWRVVVLDRMGDLARAYAIATVAVVGGGFGKHGGHNPLEPVMAGTPVIFGPHFGHFESEAQALVARVPEAQVADAAQLGHRLAEWLASTSHRRDVARLQRQALPDGAAIARRYVDALQPWLGGLQA